MTEAKEREGYYLPKYRDVIRIETIEECARVAEQWYEEHDDVEYPQGLIRAIRALKDKP